MLLHGTHHDVWSAALSIARNRASKIEKLRGSGLDAIADRSRAGLDDDVETFIAEHPDSPHLAARLREAAQSNDQTGV